MGGLLEVDSENLFYLESVFTEYEKDPTPFDSKWKGLFESWDKGLAQSLLPKEVGDSFRVSLLMYAYRKYGHLLADTDPIASKPTEIPRQLRLETLHFDQRDLCSSFPTCGLLKQDVAPLQEILDTLQEIYCGKIGVEYMDIQDPQVEKWIQERVEPNRCKANLSIEQKKLILQHLNCSELFESFVHTKYVGQKRFSLEGGETLIPILAGLIEKGADLGAEEFVLGMAHRGRLNVLANILDKAYSLVFEEFQEGYIPLSFEGSGDVKYHKGFSSLIETIHGRRVRVDLAPNPSHLEAVNPVVEGAVRAKQHVRNDVDQTRVIPILVHGDAALASQGVVYETLQLYGLEGYATGGTIHIIVNNQVGFTTSPQEGRSTRYCSDIARAFGAPVFHVNGEDPEGCLYAAFLAMELRQTFHHCDVFIDLNCYRKYGHNEADEPAFTQPKMYQEIRKKAGVRESYRDFLIYEGVVERKMAETLETQFKLSLQESLSATKLPTKGIQEEMVEDTAKKRKNQVCEAETCVTKELLYQVAEKVTTVPQGYTLHKKLERLLQRRHEMVIEGVRGIDWGMGEMLAYGTLLSEGYDVRLSGQDSGRGTFSHRHSVWVDQEDEKKYVPLQHISDTQGSFEVLNSPLSEYAVLGFEYGYSLMHPKGLVIWEAQFGDFSNGAQVIHDQFISTGEQKWGQCSSLVLFLPHGYEGQGSEHSSARMERFLALAGEDNLVIVNPTTPAQFFHLLRRHVLESAQKPLVIFTPKGLLRHPKCVSEIGELTKGKFLEVIDDPKAGQEVEMLVFCCGRIYYDLLEERSASDRQKMAIVRIEQLYPLDLEKVEAAVKAYPNIKDVVWVQEEPENMGAWDFVRPNLRKGLPSELKVRYVGRSRSASPAAGSFTLHEQEHKKIMFDLFGTEFQDTKD